MSQLFIVYLGGSAPKANIELHDVQFVIGNTIEDTYEQLRQNWFGTVKGLHLDSYKALKGADGYQISIQDRPQNFNKKLYFVNLGGYDESKLNELHEFALFVAVDKIEAKKKALKALLEDSLIKHKDNLMEVDDCLELSSIDGKYIHLNPSDEEYDLKPDWFGYRVIG
ncbi:DUF1543 domain-containing protein [Francisella philomiragia]|uniref:DUF1543 domain-containing protein n=1 Tax=Francisella philomiragia subsp. philomiragia (strain ATCC 25017 / CCUG 19701 / FSC 153 / O\|nr:DUF1543 domain-containing protein [Francisella philomiragia]AJI46902.1 hypothetical protein BF30_430 [Francisella philomiragia]AJI50029.1 hypothetical protein KU46_1122 [Francisella philomiragia]MBK2020109.1 DUF1543 domain-containing protein [Francisella philomiragia]MBK2029571.1 DUF1543 domain-containing protein [Francisella philomiragia]MBK2263367.1 DUF1543 domain-containing protein [Francisella philomiragia]